jgi:signal peptidase I
VTNISTKEHDSDAVNALTTLTKGPAKDKEPTDWWAEFKSIALLIFLVLCFHSLIAKPFYIPSVSMAPTLLVGDRLIVSKYPYGWSWVSPTFHILPRMEGRLLGKMPKRGDIVILTPRNQSEDWIKRVIAVAGDRFEMRAGTIYLNGKAIREEAMPDRLIPVDANEPCGTGALGMGINGTIVTGGDGKPACSVSIVRETLPGGSSYDTIRSGPDLGADDFGPITIPAGHVFLMGDNRNQSSDSRVAEDLGGLGGPIPWENIGGRAEFITFSLDGSMTLNPMTWLSAFRSGRAFSSLRPDDATPP